MARQAQLYPNGLYYQAGFGPAQLTGPGSSNEAQTSADAVITVDRADGTLYVVASTSATAPSAENIEAGTGTGVVASASQAVASTGQKTVPVTGLQAGTNYFFHFTHKNPSGWRASRRTSNQFTTQSGGVATDYFFAASGSDSNDGSQGTPWQTVTKANSLSLTAGDTLHFNRGDSFSGHLQVSQTDITVRDYGSGALPVLERITMSGASYELLNLDVDQAKGSSICVTIAGANNGTITDCEPHNSTSNGIDIRDSTGTIISGCEIHHLMKGAHTDASNPDAHGIVLTTGSNTTATITLINNNIHHYSGDGFQVNPNRKESDGVTDIHDFDITVFGQGNTFWTSPLTEEFNAGWPVGVSPGENVIDTKADGSKNNHITLELENTIAHGFNMTDTTSTSLTRRSAFNLKENITAKLDRLDVYDGDIAFRVRGDEGFGNATVTIMNAVVYDVDKTFRIESGVTNLKVYNNTFGTPGTTFLEPAAGGLGTGSDLRNNAFLGTKPTEFSHATNIEATSADFNASASDDYRLVSDSDLVGAGDTIAVVEVDRNGNTRSAPYEVGAYDGFVGGFAFFSTLIAHPNFTLEKAFSSASTYTGGATQQLADSVAAGMTPGRWTYDATEDAARLYWPQGLTSNSGANAMRFGDTPSYSEAVPQPFGTLGTGTFLFVWDWKYSEEWAISNRNSGALLNTLDTHKAFMASEDGDQLTLEPRSRYTGGSNPFGEGGPSGSEACNIDLRTYIGGGVGGDALDGQLATIKPLAGQWYRQMLFLDGASGEVSMWAHLEGGSLVQLHNKSGGSGTFDMNKFRGISGFHIKFNSSQDLSSDDKGIVGDSYMWGRNWVCLSGLSYAEAAALVSQSSW